MTMRELAPAFALLDAYEGEEFNRALQPVTLQDGTKVWAWCYVLASASLAEGAELIPGGDRAVYIRGN